MRRRDNHQRTWWIVLILLAGLCVPTVGTAITSCLTEHGTYIYLGSWLFDQARFEWGPAGMPPNSMLVVDSCYLEGFSPKGNRVGKVSDYSNCRGFINMKDFYMDYTATCVNVKCDDKLNNVVATFIGVVKGYTGKIALVTVTMCWTGVGNIVRNTGQCTLGFRLANGRVATVTINGAESRALIPTVDVVVITIDGIIHLGPQRQGAGTYSWAVAPDRWFGFSDDATLTISKSTR